MKKHRAMKTVDVVVWTLLTIGGLNWGMVGLFNIDVIAVFFGSMTAATRIIYVLVGVAGLYEVLGVKAISQRWGLHYGASPAA